MTAPFLIISVPGWLAIFTTVAYRWTRTRTRDDPDLVERARVRQLEREVDAQLRLINEEELEGPAPQAKILLKKKTK